MQLDCSRTKEEVDECEVHCSPEQQYEASIASTPEVLAIDFFGKSELGRRGSS